MRILNFLYMIIFGALAVINVAFQPTGWIVFTFLHIVISVACLWLFLEGGE